VNAPPRPAALVTGASSGIGLELARLCAKGGHDVILVARNEPKMQELAAYLAGMYHVRVEVIAADLSDPGAPEAVLDEVAGRGLGVDVLINDAGFGQWGLFGRADGQRVLDMIQVNVTALTQLTRLVLPRMVTQRKGRILNVASTAGFVPGPIMAVYYATKAFVISFSEAIANEVDGTGISVTVLCPGPVRTPFHERAGRGSGLLHDSPAMQDADVVALAGYRGMMRGRRLVVPGWLNKLVVFAPRLLPRWLVLRIVRRLQEQR
jgi:uncharacterized protein